MTRILVVEDEASIALALEDDLKKEGYEVLKTRIGVENVQAKSKS
jgi:DNA-binding response OmpR family regulator